MYIHDICYTYYVIYYVILPEICITILVLINNPSLLDNINIIRCV